MVAPLGVTMTASRRATWIFAAAFVAAALSGCASGPAPYGPKTADTVTGYTDEQLAQNRFRVTYVGNSTTSRDIIEDYLLFRAAQVTQSAGAQWFVFAARDTKAKTSYFSNFEGWPGWHRGFGWYRHGWSWPYDEDVESRPITRYQAYAEIVFLTPEQAKADPRALNAQDVIDHLGPKVLPPPAAPENH
jgi:hypothetical protein